MHQSLNLDSIPDDALFESGTGSWNQNFQLGTLQQGTLQQGTLNDRTNTMALHNQENARNIRSTDHERLDRMNGRYQDNRGRQPIARSQSPPEELLAVFDAMIDQSQLGLSQPDVEHGGARAKTYRNKENRNKNIAKKKNGFVVSNEEKARDQQHKSKEVTAGWEPSLQFKRYSDDDDINGSENTCRKVINHSIQRKQNINKNMMKSQSELAADTNTGSSDSLLNVAGIPLPAGLDPVSNPRNISNIYVKNVNNLELSTETDLETDFYSVHHNDNSNRAGRSSERLYENPNVKQIHNNLWDGQIKDKNQGNVDIGKVRLDQTTIPVVKNLPVDDNTTVLKLATPINLHRAGSDSGLNTSIVVPITLAGSTDNLLQFNSTSASVGSSQSLVSPLNTSPTVSLTNSLVTDSLHFSDSIPPNLSSNVLFGDGISDDFIIAQQLQQQYDREHREMQRRRQYDIVPDETPYRETEGYNLAGATTETETLDYKTANEYQTLNDSLTNNIAPVYEERQSATHNTIYIPCENQIADHTEDQFENETENQEDNTEEVDRDREGVSPETRESHQLQNDEQYPTSYCPREPIYIPYREDAGRIVQPEPSLPSSLVVRGNVARQPPEQLDDAELARRLQEQQDEEYARRLQEEESEEEHHHEHRNFHGNHSNRVDIRNLEQNNMYRNYQPLHSRFGHTWTNRPLRVGPSLGAAGNNVADSRVRSRNTWDRPLQQSSDNNEFAYLDTVHSLSVDEGYDIPPGQDYYYRYHNDPDLMLDDNGEDRLVSINRDPQLLATLLMTRAPHMMIPNHIDLNDYEALWELAENLGEVRRVGMDENDISMLPVHTYKRSSSGNSDDNKTDCLVCLSEFVDGEKLRTLPCCHIYHVDCIDEWLRRNAICPVCRQSAVNRD